MTTLKKITVEELRALIAEELNEDNTIKDASGQEGKVQSNGLVIETDQDETATADKPVTDDKTILERWRKLAGILNG